MNRGNGETGKRRLADSPTHRLSDSALSGDSFGAALKYALKILGYRDRSISETRQKLTGKGFSKDVVDGTLAYLEEKAFIDDRRLAELLMRDAVERRHYGAQGVRSYLI